jgi:hypothetical protein
VPIPGTRWNNTPGGPVMLIAKRRAQGVIYGADVGHKDLKKHIK